MRDNLFALLHNKKMINQFLLLRKVALSGVLSPIGFWKQLMQSTGINLLKLTLDEILV